MLDGYLRTVEAKIAAGLPGKRNYSEDEVLGFENPSRFNNLSVKNALVQTGVLSPVVITRHKEDGFLAEDGWEDDPDAYERFTVFRVTAVQMDLIKDLQSLADAAPYFISFYSAEGRDAATKLHDVLQEAKIPGFLSDEMPTGTQWQKEIVSSLKAAKTIFFVESEGYHTRPRCKVERDFAVAKGARVFRLLLCEANALTDVPDWLNENINYEVVKNASGFQLSQHVLGLSLPAKIASLPTRRRGGREIVNRLTPPQVLAEAEKIDLLDQLDGSPMEKKVHFAAAAFAAETIADRFCREVDLSSQF